MQTLGNLRIFLGILNFIREKIKNKFSANITELGQSRKNMQKQIFRIGRGGRPEPFSYWRKKIEANTSKIHKCLKPEKYTNYCR